jgi:HAD superfamily phosphoserine phosphatase-like hydrolase
MSRKMSFKDYEKSITTAFTSSLTNLSTDTIDAAAEAIVKKSGHKVYKFTREYIIQLKESGYFLLAVSGSHQEIAEPFAELYGFDDCIGTIFERKGSTYTGGIVRHVPSQKAELVKQFAETYNFTFKDSVAVGDSMSDVSMLEIVDKPLVFNPAHDLLEVAKEKGWDIVIERKNVAYRLQREAHGTYLLAEADQL